jgi:hypothetical protein
MRHLASILYILLIAASGSVFAQDEPADLEPEPILVGPARLDLNIAAGDQSQRQTFTVPQPGATITVDVAVTEGGKDRSGFEILLSYDPAQVAYETARPVDLFEGAFLMAAAGTGQIGLTGLLLEEKSARTIGSIVQITFTVLDGFQGESRVSLESALLGTALKIDSVQVGTQSSVVILGGEITTVVLDKPDFDGDGAVGFTDFIIFATGFGAASGDQSYNPLLDLDSNGDVGFSDFLVFALSFGT